MELGKEKTPPKVLAELTHTSDVVDELKDLANSIRRDARRLAPVRTGNLRRNMQVEKETDPETGKVRFLVGWGPAGWYGWMVESGTEDTTPRPHLIPAAIKNGAMAPGGGAS